ncbi:MAG TPA: 7-cyano-7-deazaguanine synthase QueC [Nitrolancea sp.]|nr:7-cyano-7-deazaguanine synthase QueC [Nitrolancea sp.]
MADMRAMSKRAVVLLSGGLDSTTAAWLARESGFELFALSFDYGQRHARELESAALIAHDIGARQHQIVRINVSDWAASSLTGQGEIPTESSGDSIPSTWVPARNHIFLAVASGYAEVVGASAIYIGVSQVDYSGYPDCRSEFIDAFQRAADLASKRFVEESVSIPVLAPFLHVPKSGVVRLGLALGVDYGQTWSCYQGGDVPCQRCDSCRLRAQAFAELGVPDPLLARQSG